MGNGQPPRQRGQRLTKPRSTTPDVSGETAAAQQNRANQTRHAIIEALRRLGTPLDRWPDFVRSFYSDPRQQIEYQACMTPLPYQPPEFDRLNQTVEDWVNRADQGWERHRQEFLQQCQSWVAAGVDEPIEAAKRTRGAGEGAEILPEPNPKGERSRGANTPLERRYEWAAKYLLGVPLKEIAGADADPSTVGRIAREILRTAGWPRQ